MPRRRAIVAGCATSWWTCFASASKRRMDCRPAVECCAAAWFKRSAPDIDRLLQRVHDTRRFLRNFSAESWVRTKCCTSSICNWRKEVVVLGQVAVRLHGSGDLHLMPTCGCYVSTTAVLPRLLRRSLASRWSLPYRIVVSVAALDVAAHEVATLG